MNWLSWILLGLGIAVVLGLLLIVALRSSLSRARSRRPDPDPDPASPTNLLSRMIASHQAEIAAEQRATRCDDAAASGEETARQLSLKFRQARDFYYALCRVIVEHCDAANKALAAGTPLQWWLLASPQWPGRGTFKAVTGVQHRGLTLSVKLDHIEEQPRVTVDIARGAQHLPGCEAVITEFACVNATREGRRLVTRLLELADAGEATRPA